MLEIPWVLANAIIALLIKFFLIRLHVSLHLFRLGLTLHGGHGHSHGGHGHSHGSDESSLELSHSKTGSKTTDENSHDAKKHTKHKDINVRAAAIHVLGDLVQSVGVFVAALLIYFKVCFICYH